MAYGQRPGQDGEQGQWPGHDGRSLPPQWGYGQQDGAQGPGSTGSGGMTSAGSRQGATDDGSRLNGGTGSNRMGRGTGSEDTHPADPWPAFSQCRRPGRDSRGSQVSAHQPRSRLTSRRGAASPGPPATRRSPGFSPSVR